MLFRLPKRPAAPRRRPGCAPTERPPHRYEKKSQRMRRCVTGTDARCFAGSRGRQVPPRAVRGQGGLARNAGMRRAMPASAMTAGRRIVGSKCAAAKAGDETGGGYPKKPSRRVTSRRNRAFRSTGPGRRLTASRFNALPGNCQARWQRPGGRLATVVVVRRWRRLLLRIVSINRASSGVRGCCPA